MTDDTTSLLTHRDRVESIGNGLSAELDADGVLASVFDRVVNAERSIAVIFDVDVHIAASGVSSTGKKPNNKWPVV
jgi:hypothetical protein